MRRDNRGGRAGCEGGAKRARAEDFGGLPPAGVIINNQ